MKRKLLSTMIICIIGSMFIAGCGGKEAAAPAEDPQPEQEISEDQTPPTETPVPEVNETDDEETLPEPETKQDSPEPVDNYYAHRFDSYDDLLFAYKEAQKANKTILRQNTQSEINRIQSEIYQIDKEIEHLEAPTKGVYGIYRDASQTNRISNLNARKRDLEQQLKQLKGEIGPA